MKREDLFESIGALEDDIIKESESCRHFPLYLPAGIAACLTILLGAAIYSAQTSTLQNSALENSAPDNSALENSTLLSPSLSDSSAINTFMPDSSSATDTSLTGNSSVPDLSTAGDFISADGHASVTANDNSLKDNSADGKDISKAEHEPFISIDTILASNSTGNHVLETHGSIIGIVPIGAYEATYEKVTFVQFPYYGFSRVPYCGFSRDTYEGTYDKISSVENSILKNSKGQSISDSTEWHLVSGHEDMHYLIREEEGTYSLWKFLYFNSDEYPYNDVLTLVYHIYSADDIQEIISEPATMDNSDEGKAIQAQIGTSHLMDRDSICRLYQTISSLTCLGSNHWDMIGLNDDTKDSMHNAVLLSRYLTIVTKNGNMIDSLKYTAVSNMFYENSGVAYHKLSTQQANEISDILNIGCMEIQPQNPLMYLEQPQTADSVTVSPHPKADQTSVHTLEYITQLQEQISNAMIAGELPFVISSAVLESPYHLQVTVTTTDEEELAKLQAFDTQGGALEIQYTSENLITPQ